MLALKSCISSCFLACQSTSEVVPPKKSAAIHFKLLSSYSFPAFHFSSLRHLYLLSRQTEQFSGGHALHPKVCLPVQFSLARAELRVLDIEGGRAQRCKMCSRVWIPVSDVFSGRWQAEVMQMSSQSALSHAQSEDSDVFSMWESIKLTGGLCFLTDTWLQFWLRLWDRVLMLSFFYTVKIKRD